MLPRSASAAPPQIVGNGNGAGAGAGGDDFVVLERDGTMPAAEPRVIKQGWLTKEGGFVRNWQKRWFVLTRDNRLDYFKPDAVDTGAAPQGTIDLARVERIAADKSERGRFAIDVPGRTYHCKAADENEMNEWISTLSSRLHSSPSSLSPPPAAAHRGRANSTGSAAISSSSATATATTTSSAAATTTKGKAGAPTGSRTPPPSGYAPPSLEAPSLTAMLTKIADDKAEARERRLADENDRARAPQPLVMQSALETLEQQRMLDKTLTRWVNFVVDGTAAGAAAQPRLTTLTDLSDGLVLCRLAERLTSEPLEQQANLNPTHFGLRAQNISFALGHLRARWCSERASPELPVVNKEAILNKQSTEVVVLVRTIAAQFELGNVECDGVRGFDAVVARARAAARTHDVPWIHRTLAENVEDGRLLCALVDATAFDVHAMHKHDRIDNIGRAFDTAYAKHGVPKLLDAADFLARPDEMSCALYLALLFRMVK